MRKGCFGMNRDAKIFIAGDDTMIGLSLLRCLEEQGHDNIVTFPKELELTDQLNVKDYLIEERPDYLIMAAGKSGGIMANKRYPADFIYDNVQIQSNIIHFSYQAGVKKLVFLASSCSYPRDCLQPTREEYLLTGPLEPTSEAYAIAKLAGIKMCQAYNFQYGTDFVPLVPTNIYGPGDDFDPETGHVMAALISKMHRAKMQGAKEVSIWGTGLARREFLYVDDLAKAIIFVLSNHNRQDVINVGFGDDLTIRDLAFLIKGIIDYDGEIFFDESKPEGAMLKRLDGTRMTKMGWRPTISLSEGISRTYEWYKKQA
jgi:GDP-L-fucose synthase